MFGRKKRELEEAKKRVVHLESLVASLRLTNESLQTVIDHITTYKNNMPEDCVMGGYCAGCVFSRNVHVSNCDEFGHRIFSVYSYCGKGESCKHFIQKEVDSNDQN